MIQNVAILGATGTLGSTLIPALLEAGFTVTAITRPNSSHQAASHPNVITKQAPYHDLSALTAIFENQHAIIEAFNPAAATDQSTIIRAAIAAGVQHVITPEFGPDTFNPHIEELLVYSPKIAAQRELQKVLAETGSGLSWTAIITGAWYDWGIGQGLFWIDKNEKTITRFGTGEQKYAISTLGRIAQAVASLLVWQVKVLKEPYAYRNRPAYFASHIVTTNRLIEVVREVAGHDWRVNDVALEGFLQEGKRLWQQDAEAGVQNRLATPAYAMLGTVALFDEQNRYGSNFCAKIEPGWDEGDEVLRDRLRRLLL